MTRLLFLDSAVSDNTLPVLTTLESYETAIMALSPRAWWDASLAAYRSDASGKCAQLNDRSGNGFHLVQATAANQPPVTADYWGALNGVHRDAILFDGSADRFMETAGNVYDGTTIWSEVIVWKPLATAACCPIGVSASSGSSTYGFYQNNATKLAGLNGGVLTADFPALQNVPMIMIGTFNYPGSGNASVSVQGTYISGGLQTTVKATASIAVGITAPGTNHSLLGAFSATHTLKANAAIAERIVLKSDLQLNAPAVAMLQAYFAMKYR